MLVRMPSAAEYAAKVEIEQRWLPILAPLLPVQIPIPIEMGKPGNGYPWNWSVYRWIEGEGCIQVQITNRVILQKSCEFLVALHKIDPNKWPSSRPTQFLSRWTLKSL